MSEPISPICFTIDDASKVTGLGKTRIYEEINAGRLKAVKSGKRTLIPRAAIDEWLTNLGSYPARPGNATT